MAVPVKRNLQKASQSRVFTIEDRAAPQNAPVYQTLARASGVTRALGGITPIRIPDPSSYGSFVTVDKIRGQPDLPGLSVEFRKERRVSDILRLVEKGCPFDIQLHVGACKDPSDFDLGWELVQVLEDALASNYATSDLGTFDADGEAAVTETLDLVGSDYYEIGPLAFGEIGESTILQEVIDVVICDSKACGECGLSSDGCQKVFALTTSQGASPGLPAKVIITADGGTTLDTSVITSLAANKNPSAMACVGPYLVVVSLADDSIHYAELADLINGTETWTEVTTGIVASGSPTQIFSLGRTQTWIVGEGGYVYFSDDITGGVEVQSAGDLTVSNLLCIHGVDSQNLIAGGETNALIKTANGGVTWSLATGPAAQAAANIRTCWMMSNMEWQLGYSDGELWYTKDGGVTWTQKALPGALVQVDDLVYSKRTVGYLAGRSAAQANGKLLRTIDGGFSWYVLPEAAGISIPSSNYFNGIAACSDDVNLLWAGGMDAAGAQDGILLKGA